MTRRRNTISPKAARVRLKLGPDKRLKDPYNGTSGEELGPTHTSALMPTRRQQWFRISFDVYVHMSKYIYLTTRITFGC